MEHVLHIFVVLKLVKEFFNGGTLFLGDFLHIVGDALEFGRHDFKAVLLQIGLYGGVVLEAAVEHDGFVSFLVHIVNEFVHAVVNEFKLEIFEADAIFGFDFEHCFVVKEESERALCAERAAVLGEVGAHIGHCCP